MLYEINGLPIKLDFLHIMQMLPMKLKKKLNAIFSAMLEDKFWLNFSNKNV